MNSRYTDIHNIPMQSISTAYSRTHDTRTPRRQRRVGATPKFIPGDVIGEFTVKDYIGYSSVHPGKGTVLNKEHHWYRCKCSCEVIEIRSQQQLIDKRRPQQCSTHLKQPI